MSEAAMKLEEMDEQEQQEELQEVAVLDDASAELLMRRIREADEQYERMEAWYKFQLEKAKEIRDRTVEWAERSLRAYFDMVPTHDTKTQRKYDLPGGTMTLKRQEPQYDVNDEQTVPWLKANRPELVRVKEETDWAKLKKELILAPDGERMMTKDGEIVPGVTATVRPDKFTVKVK